LTCSESDTYPRVGQHSVTSPMLYPIFEECFASYMQQAHLLGGQTLPQSVSICFENK
jgi:hypothetical protein